MTSATLEGRAAMQKHPSTHPFATLRLVTLSLSIALVAAFLSAPAARAQIGSDRYASIVVDAASGRVISAVDPDEPRRPASLTKVMTAFLLFDAVSAGRLRMTDQITISANAAAAPPSKLGLPPGSRMTVEQALLAIITKSANDVAVAIAEHLAGSEPAFARLMTLKARSLGMRDTVFRNASGLPDREQVTTARDMATLGRRLIADHPSYYGYFATDAFRFRGKVHRNHNHRILTGFDGADGIKTGYIRDSGFNLLASAQRDGRRIIAVVFGGASGPERDRHIAALMDDAFTGGTAVASRPPVTLVSRAQASTGGAAQQRERATMQQAERQATTRQRAGTATDWAIQVGAFSTRHQALAAAREAERRIGVARAETDILPTRGRNGTLFRAQVTNLTAAEARAACAERQKRRQPCLAIAPSNVAATARPRG
jgi:D-alanyl-D-alanine carboxypeptidase